jgi:hypothetical protein
VAFLLVTPSDASPMMKLQQRDWNHPPRPEKLGVAPTANGVGRIPGLWAVRGSPDSDADIPQAGNRPVGKGECPRWGGHFCPRRWREVAMKLVRRLALAAGSLLALVLAGGAHARF